MKIRKIMVWDHILRTTVKKITKTPYFQVPLFLQKLFFHFSLSGYFGSEITQQKKIPPPPKNPQANNHH